MENNDQTNYELGVLKEELKQIYELIENFRTENIDLQNRTYFNPKDSKNYLNTLNKMKLINTELKSFKEKISPIFEMISVYPNFPKSGVADEKKAIDKCNMITTQSFSTSNDNIINEMIISMDETIENGPDAMKKYKEFQSFHNKLIVKILENNDVNEKKK